MVIEFGVESVTSFRGRLNDSNKGFGVESTIEGIFILVQTLTSQISALFARALAIAFGISLECVHPTLHSHYYTPTVTSEPRELCLPLQTSTFAHEASSDPDVRRFTSEFSGPTTLICRVLDAGNSHVFCVLGT